MPAEGRQVASAGAILLALGILLGAFAAHGLRGSLEPRALGWWQTAVDYQMWNAVGLVALGAMGLRRRVGALIAGGVLLFSGSLYVMALTGATGLGAVTPVGGLLMVGGWTWAALALMRPSI